MVGYDGILAWMRLDKIGQREPDRFVFDVLTFHAAIEAEMDHLLSRTLPRPEMLKGGGLGFAQKIAVVGAAWQGDPEQGNALHLALRRFNDLRNAVAHNDDAKGVKNALRNAVEAVAVFDPSIPDIAQPRDLALSIGAFMGGVTFKRRLWVEVPVEDDDGVQVD